jgi:5-formyltetrahydrofolate cyclo-ligase
VASLVDFLVVEVAPEQWIVGYHAIAGEVEVGSVLAALDGLGRPVGLVRTPESGKRLSVHPASSEQEEHRFGFRQPVVHAPEVADESIGAVLVPGLAFDRLGGRLGFGAGFYDRFLGRLISGIPLIGIAALAPVPKLPTEGHDVAMTHLVVDHEVRAVPLSR